MASHREILKTNRRARRKRYFRRSVTASLLAILILLFGGWYFWNSPLFALTNVAVTGAAPALVERLTQTVNDVLARQYLGLFHQRVNWFYPSAALLAILRQQFSELATISITNPSWGTLRIEVSARWPAALWCAGDCYYLDSTGLAYSSAPQFSNNPLLVLTGLSLAMPIGSRPLAISDFEYLLQTRTMINQLLQTVPDLAGQTIEAVSLAEPIDYTFNIRNVRLTSGGWRLLIVRRDTVETIASRLVAAFSAPAFLAEYHSSSSTRGGASAALGYLDIRFDRKVFYKFVP